MIWAPASTAACALEPERPILRLHDAAFPDRVEVALRLWDRAGRRAGAAVCPAFLRPSAWAAAVPFRLDNDALPPPPACVRLQRRHRLLDLRQPVSFCLSPAQSASRSRSCLCERLVLVVIFQKGSRRLGAADATTSLSVLPSRFFCAHNSFALCFTRSPDLRSCHQRAHGRFDPPAVCAPLQNPAGTARRSPSMRVRQDRDRAEITGGPRHNHHKSSVRVRGLRDHRAEYSHSYMKPCSRSGAAPSSRGSNSVCPEPAHIRPVISP